jgi:predicted AAA+ superfamily ATPase
MIIHRDVNPLIRKYLDSSETHSSVLLVQGARQVGKTLLCAQAIAALPKSRPSVSLNLELRPDIKLLIDGCQQFSEFESLLKSKMGFMPGSGAVLFIDEAQESKSIGGFVRFIKESWRDTKCILTGSSMSRLFDKNTRIPVGRYETLTVRPFSFREFLRAKGLEENFDPYLCQREHITPFIHNQLLEVFEEYMRVGGLPSSVIAYIEGKDFRSIQALIFASQRDDFYRKERMKEHLFSDAMTEVAKQLGNPGKLSHIAANHRDASQIVESLKSWNLVHEVHQAGSLPTQSFHPKWYLYDLGILSFLRMGALPEISLVKSIDPVLRTPLGGLVENAVLLQLMSKEKNGNYLKISGWKKNNKQGIEVDFVTSTSELAADSVLPIEVKASKKIDSNNLSNLKQYLKFSGLKRGVLFALESPRKIEWESAEIDILPIYLDPP